MIATPHLYGAAAYSPGSADPRWSWAWERLVFAAPYGLGITANMAPRAGHGNEPTLPSVTAHPGPQRVLPDTWDPTSHAPGTRFGAGVDLTGNVDAVRVRYPHTPAAAVVRNRAMTIFVALETTGARLNGFQSAGYVTSRLNSSDSGSAGFMLGAFLGLVPILQIERPPSSITQFIWPNSVPAADGSYGSIAVRRRSPVSGVAGLGAWNAYVNGVRSTTEHVEVNAPGTPTTASRIALARRTALPTVGPADGFGMLGRYIAVYVWRRALHDWQLAALHRDPLGPFRAALRRRNVVAPAPDVDPCDWFDAAPGASFFSPLGAGDFFQAAPGAGFYGEAAGADLFGGAVSGGWLDEKEC